MNKPAVELLVVDDDGFIRDVLEMMLTGAGYAVTLAVDGEDAWAILNSEKHKFSAVLLDRTMPRLDGMELLLRVKADKRFAGLPIIFQTGIDHPADIAAGIKAGAFYYLVKPVNENVLFAIVQSAVSAFQASGSEQSIENQEQVIISRMLKRGEFHFTTLQEARALATTLSGFYPQPQRSFLGISELLINAVEHGNLGISYQEKSQLLKDGALEAEIERRLLLPENAKKVVTVELEHNPGDIRLSISDCGEGFDSQKYMEMSPERAFDPNGRGIAMSKMMSFDTLEYKGKGNQVVAGVKI